MINKFIFQFILKLVKSSKTQLHSGVKPQETPEFHYKIPYIGHFSVIAQNKIPKLANGFIKPTDIKLVFTTFKIKNLFNMKEAFPKGPCMHVVYKFPCASCKFACSVGETSRHFSMCARALIFRHIFSCLYGICRV